MNPRSLLRLIRPVNCLMMGFAVIVGAIIATGPDLTNTWPNLLLGFITGFALTGSAMAVNDYYDREIDAINEPDRPIPSGSTTPTEALVVSSLLSMLGVLAAFLTNPLCLVIAIFTWFIMMWYSTRGKRTGLLGNISVSACIAAPFVYGGLAVSGASADTSLIFSLLAFLTNTGREVAKGIVDAEGDRKEGMRTVAVSKGEKVAALFASIFFASAAISSFIPLALGLVSSWYAPPVLITDTGLIYSSASILRNPSRENSRRIKNLVLVWMMFGLIGFLLGSFT